MKLDYLMLWILVLALYLHWRGALGWRHIGKGLHDIGRLSIGYFDGPAFLIAWDRVEIWYWRRGLRTALAKGGGGSEEAK